MKMSRYYIEDIVSQNKRGIIFRAHDNDRGHSVALRRFLPFGQDGSGLQEDEAAALQAAAQRLDALTHPGLRSIISSSVDPIDGIPFIVAEWIDGTPLETFLAGGTLDPLMVIEILKLALEVSLTLSEVLGEEAVWVETEIDSIFVSPKESNRGFVFWLSPFKWLGAEYGSRKLTAIFELGEQLTGWKGKLIGKQSGQGLGAWMKWLRTHPDASLAEALEVLEASTSSDPSPPILAPSSRKNEIVALPKVEAPASSNSRVWIAAAVVTLLVVGGFGYQRLSSRGSSNTAQEQRSIIPQATIKKERSISDVNALAAKLAKESAEKRAAENSATPPDQPQSSGQ
jgi:hypothetical protein